MAVVALAMAVSLAGAATPGDQRAQATVIRGVSITASEAVVTIEADGPLPPPSVGVLDGPPRIFLDFPGVSPGTARVTRSLDPRIRRVRLGLYQAQPPVTRVVVDLMTPQPHRIVQSLGRVMIIVGVPPVASTPVLPPAAPPVPPLSDPPRPLTPAVPVPRETPVPVPPPAAPMPDKRPPPAPASPRPTSEAQTRPPLTKDLERYRRQVSSALDRLRLQQSLLISLDAAEVQTPERMQMAVEEFDRIRQELTAIKPQETVRPQHDLLIQSSTLGLMATRLRLEAFRTANAATLKNAASAAAGSILLLERACADLGCPDWGR